MSTAITTVVNHNIGHGSTQGPGLYADGLAPLGTVLRVVQEQGADAITLQEVTESEYYHWRNVHGWHGVFVPMTEGSENSTGQPLGQAVLSRYPLLSSSTEPLGHDGVVTGKDFNLLCASFDHPDFRGKNDDWWVATTHLWSAGHDHNGDLYSGAVNDAVRNSQANRVAAYLNPRVGYARKYILTGDFNTSAKTTAIDHIHKVNRNGTVGTSAKFWEGDQSDNGTHGAGSLGRGGRDTITGRKIDYFFASHTGANPHEDGIDLTLHGCAPNGGVPHEEVMRGWVKWTDVS